MKLVMQLLFIVSYPWYLAYTLILRVNVIAESGELNDTDKEQIAIELQEIWYNNPLTDQLFYSVTCTLFYTCFYYKIKSL